jgi:phosphoserine phosphatase RsbU/P
MAVLRFRTSGPHFNGGLEVKERKIILTIDNPKDTSKQALIDEVDHLRREADLLKSRLARLERAADTQKYAELILARSPAVLFRRLAAEELKARKMVYVSPNISRFGYRAEDFMSNRIMFRDIVHPDDTARTKAEIQAYVRQGIDTYKQIYRILTKDGEVRWIEDHTAVVEDPETGTRYHQGIVVDIHRRKLAEDNLRRSEEKYRRIVETTAEGFLLMDRELYIVDVNSAYCRMSAYSRDDLIGTELVDLLTPEYQPFFVANREDHFNGRPYEFECALKVATGAALPVLIHGNALHDDAGVNIGNMAFITDMSVPKKALRLAGEVQKSLLPKTAPDIQGLDIAAKTISCDEIGGDYYDFLADAQAPHSRISVVVGDISGHGLDSALLMTTARAFLRMRAAQPGTLTDTITAMNRHLVEDVFETGKFMTLFYLSLDTQRRSIEWIRAGHEPAWLFDPAEDVFEVLKGAGVALGVDETYAYTTTLKTQLKKGQIIILGTDGIWEGHNKAGEMFGKQRLQAIIRQNAARSAEHICTAIFAAHRRFTQDAIAEDDLTAVIIKINT